MKQIGRMVSYMPRFLEQCTMEKTVKCAAVLFILCYTGKYFAKYIQSMKFLTSRLWLGFHAESTELTTEKTEMDKGEIKTLGKAALFKQKISYSSFFFISCHTRLFDKTRNSHLSPNKKKSSDFGNRCLGGFIEVGLSRGYSYTQWTLGKPRDNPWGRGIIALG
jgi:hypothetical protein